MISSVALENLLNLSASLLGPLFLQQNLYFALQNELCSDHLFHLTSLRGCAVSEECGYTRTFCDCQQVSHELRWTEFQESSNSA